MIIRLPKNEFAVDVYTWSRKQGKSDARIMKLDCGDDVLWQHIPGGKKDDELVAVRQLPEGHSAFTGDKRSGRAKGAAPWMVVKNSTEQRASRLMLTEAER